LLLHAQEVPKEKNRRELQSAEAEKAGTKATPKPKAGRAVRLAMRDGLRFDPPRFTANPGELLEVEIENADTTHQQHNFLLLKPGKREEVVAQALALGDTGPAREFVPQNPDVLVHSAVLAPEKLQTITFAVPKEKGIYPYVCTFPGHGMVMYGALYVGTPMPPLVKDLNVPPMAATGFVVGRGQRPFIQRMFMPDCGPAAIAVALPHDQNFCWDAGECRLRYVWRGAFIDATEHWRGKGADLGKLPGEPWWRAPIEEFPIRLGSAEAARPKVKFLGYRVEQGIPEFRYRVDDSEVFEQITATDEGIAIQFRFPGVKEDVFVRGLSGGNAAWQAAVGEWKEGILRVPAEKAGSFVLTLASPQPAISQ
jgi:azurin